MTSNYPSEGTILDTAAALLSDGDNPEYDRALVELVSDLTGRSHGDRLDTLLVLRRRAVLDVERVEVEEEERRRCTQPYCECGGSLHPLVPDAEERKQAPDTCSYCGTILVGEDCPNYGSGEEHERGFYFSLGGKPDASPSIKPLSFDNETNDYSLPDCVWWGEPVSKRPWWAKGDCSGRVGDTARGVLCEHHYNEGSKA